MTPAEVREILERVGALMTGHFKLSSGRHSDTYVQKQRVFEHPRLTMAVADALAHRFGCRSGEPAPFDVVVSPALGAIVFGNAVAYCASTRFVFAERADGVMTIRRGQTLQPGERVLVVEDVITTGGSAKEVIDALGPLGAHVIGVGALVDRSNTTPPFRLEALLRVEARDWAPDECPLCADGVPFDSPGSRYTGA